MSNTESSRTQGTEDELWQAVLARDASRDGAFVFAVRSTGIYCRPSCPSRRPRREQVSFYAVPEAAEQAGFRSCRRCKPEKATAQDPQIEIVRGACRLIEEHTGDRLSLELLGRALGVSPFHLQRTFKRLVGVSPRQYAEALRMGRFKSQLRRGGSVTTAMYGAGYGSSRSLYERAPAQLGMTPATYKGEGRGMMINYTIADSPLGSLLVAATERGVCAVRLGDSRSALLADFRREYPAAVIRPDDRGLAQWVQLLVEHLKGARPKSTCRSTFRRPLFNGGSGKSCGAFATAPQSRIARWQKQ